MSIANKLTTIAENVQKVYDAGKSASDGYTDGYSAGVEAGKQAEQQMFWETYQRGGRRNQYRYAFYDALWNDVTYNPIYTIVCSALSTDAFRYSQITDTKVDIDFSQTTVSHSTIFANCTALKTIRKLIIAENVTFTNWFSSCTALENITFEGVIGQNLVLSYSPLLIYESLINIIGCLKDYSASGTTHTLTIGTTNLDKLTDEEKAVATEKGWTLA